MKKNYAVIGVGYWGRKHVEELNEIGIAPYIADANEDMLKDLQEGTSKWYDRPYDLSGVTKDYKKILADSKIDAVSICTPNETHYQICKEALEAGKHVFIEKPMTMNYDEAVELVKLAEEKEKSLAVGHIFRYDNAIRKARQLVRSGELGDIYTTSLRWLNYEKPWDRDIIFDLATHPFDIIHFIFDRHPDEINCIGKTYRKCEGEEVAFINAKLGDMLVNMEMSWLTPEKTREVRITGSEKEILINCVNKNIFVYDFETKQNVNLNLPKSNTIQAELREFVNNYSSKVSNEYNSGEVGAEIVKVLEAAKKSLDEKRTVKVN